MNAAEKPVCDVCLRDKGIRREATHDSPTAWGCWAYLCKYCIERLPTDLRKMSVRLDEVLS